MTKGWYLESHRHAIAAMKGWRGNRNKRRLAIDRSKQAKTVFWKKSQWQKRRGYTDLKGYDTKFLKKQKLVATQEIPAFIGADMKEYGGFKPGEEVKVPEKIEKLLKDRKLVQMTDNPEKFKIKEKPMAKIPSEYKLSTIARPEQEKKYLAFLRERQKELDMLPLQDIADELKISKEEVGKITESLAKKGDIYQPRYGFARLTGVK